MHSLKIDSEEGEREASEQVLQIQTVWGECTGFKRLLKMAA